MIKILGVEFTKKEFINSLLCGVAFLVASFVVLKYVCAFIDSIYF